MYVSRGLRWNMEHREAFYSEREYQAACHMAYKYELARKADNKRLNQTADREPENLPEKMLRPPSPLQAACFAAGGRFQSSAF